MKKLIGILMIVAFALSTVIVDAKPPKRYKTKTRKSTECWAYRSAKKGKRSHSIVNTTATASTFARYNYRARK